MGAIQCCAKREKNKKEKLRGEMLIQYMKQIERKSTVFSNSSTPGSDSSEESLADNIIIDS